MTIPAPPLTTATRPNNVNINTTVQIPQANLSDTNDDIHYFMAFGLLGITVPEIERFSFFWHFGLTLHIYAHFQEFGAYFPQMTSSIVVTPKRHLLARKHVV